MQIAIFGSGYVGLVTAVFLAEQGCTVTCVDIDAQKIQSLQQGISPIYEPGLEDLIQKNLQTGHLTFTLDAKAAVAQAEIIFIAVGTPQQEDGQANMQFVESVAEFIGERIDHDIIIVNKSTVPVNTCFRLQALIARLLAERGSSYHVALVSNPEFLKEGSAIEDAFFPDRIVIGTDDEWAKEMMAKLYHRFADKIVWTTPISSEFTKYVANAMLATKISFMNEMSQIAEKIGADIEQVKYGISLDPRIGNKFINPGCGYGGSCFPKDVRALIYTAANVGVNCRLLEAVDRVNEAQKVVVFRKLQQHFPHLAGATIAIWGLSFKPNTDDLREAPSRVLIEALWDAGAKVRVYDPIAMSAFEAIYGQRNDLFYAQSKEEAVEGADALAIMTEWPDFQAQRVNFPKLKTHLKQAIIVDGRNLYDPSVLKQAGFIYDSIGRLAS